MDRAAALTRLVIDVANSRPDEAKDFVWEFIVDHCTDDDVRELAQQVDDRMNAED